MSRFRSPWVAAAGASALLDATPAPIAALETGGQRAASAPRPRRARHADHDDDRSADNTRAPANDMAQSNLDTAVTTRPNSQRKATAANTTARSDESRRCLEPRGRRGAATLHPIGVNDERSANRSVVQLPNADRWLSRGVSNDLICRIEDGQRAAWRRSHADHCARLSTL